MKEISFHLAVQSDVDGALRYYRRESDVLADLFWQELSEGFERIRLQPARYHFDESGYRRLNLKTFPYHILFEELPNRVRVAVVRHNSRKPSFGTRRGWGEHPRSENAE